jgi:ankyrin repeat protein
MQILNIPGGISSLFTTNKQPKPVQGDVIPNAILEALDEHINAGDEEGLRGILEKLEPAQKDYLEETGRLLHSAAFEPRGHQVLETILEFMPRSLETRNFDLTPLMIAAGRGNTESLQLLLEKGASPDARTHQGWTAMFCAVVADALDAVKVLLGYQSDRGLEERDNRGYTALLIAAEHVKLGPAQLLAEHGANLEATNDQGETALMLVVKKLSIDSNLFTEWLIKAGAQLDKQDDEGLTALHHAVLHANGNAIEALLNAGARNDIQNIRGKMPKDFVPVQDLSTQQQVRFAKLFKADS